MTPGFAIGVALRLRVSISSNNLPTTHSFYRCLSCNVCATSDIPSSVTRESNDNYYMGLALRQARLAYKKQEVPVGAILLTSDSNVYSGHNTVESLHDITCHAELIAIRSAMRATKAWRLEDSTLYSTLEPCPMCLSAAALARVSRIVYAAKEPRLGAVESWIKMPEYKHPFHKFQEIKGGVLEEQASKLLKNFFRERRTASLSGRPRDIAVREEA